MAPKGVKHELFGCIQLVAGSRPSIAWSVVELSSMMIIRTSLALKFGAELLGGDLEHARMGNLLAVGIGLIVDHLDIL